jgi:hypothetical protein
MKLPTDHPVTVRFTDGQVRTIVIPWSAINQVARQ